MAKKLFVGNLSWNTTNDSLNALFATVGTVASAQVITDRYTGRSRGFGFVEMTNDDEAERAKNELNGKDLDGRQISVNEAKPREEGGSRGGGGGHFRNDRGDRNDNRGDNY
ncbi:MAG TPA: RNA-binding protein [Patescibacteria group bacterium]|nr:RNA-binding protein [Patescibacteria group bacterium]